MKMGFSKRSPPASSGRDFHFLPEWKIPTYSRTIYSPDVDDTSARAALPQDADTNTLEYMSRDISANDSGSTSEAYYYDEPYLFSEDSSEDSANINAAVDGPNTVRTTIADLALVAEFELLRLRRLEDEGREYLSSSSDEYDSDNKATRSSEYTPADKLGRSGRSTLTHLIIVAGLERSRLQQVNAQDYKAYPLARDYINTSTADFVSDEDTADIGDESDSCTSTMYSESDTASEENDESSSTGDDESNSSDWDADVSDNECDDFDGWDF